MKVTLQINGREMTFSEKELIAILEKHFSSETVKEETNTTAEGEVTYEIATTPTEGKMFKVDPISINRKLFEEKREDEEQENTRQLILDGFVEVDANPKKYSKVFYTMIPEKTWKWKKVAALKNLATVFGHHNGNWVEQALEWAQRINNGESWESLCNEPDTVNWHRLVEWEDGYCQLVGGAGNCCEIPASDVNFVNATYFNNCSDVVPLVVLYE